MRNWVLLIFLLFNSLLLRAEMEGYPSFRVYPSKEHEGHDQTFGILEDTSGLMYFANLNNLLVFNGKTWDEVDELIMESVYSVQHGFRNEVAVGAFGHFGYLLRTPLGKISYRSLLNMVPEKERDFSEVWSILKHPAGTLYCTKKAIYLWNGNTIKVYHPLKGDGFHKFFEVNGRIIVREFSGGLMEWNPDGLHPLPGGEYFSELKIDFITEQGKDWLIGTRTSGFVLYSPTANHEPREYACEAGDFLKNASLYHGIKLKDGNFAFASSLNGVIIANQQGEILEHYDEQILSENKTLYVYQDSRANLWVANDKAICRVDYSYPFRWYLHDKAIVNSLTKDHVGNMWAGTSKGIYVIHPTDKGYSVSDINTNAGFCSVVSSMRFGNQPMLLASTQSGLMYFDEKGREHLIDEQAGFFLIKALRSDSSLLMGAGNGLIRIYQWRNGRFHILASFENLDASIFSMDEDEQGRVWFTANDSRLMRLSPRSSGGFVLHTFRFSEAMVMDNEYFRVFNWNHKLFINTSQGLMDFKGQGSDGKVMFKRSREFAWSGNRQLLLFRTFVSNQNGKLWMMFEDKKGNREVGYLDRDAGGNYFFYVAPFGTLSESQTNAFADGRNGEIWMASNSGIVQVQNRQQQFFSRPYPAVLSAIKVGSRAEFLYQKSSRELRVFPYRDNQVSFTFTAYHFVSADALRFSYYLEGLDQSWSEWTSDYSRSFNSLQEGEYTFHVKARDIYRNESEEAVFSFRILPPWYRTVWAYLAYLIIGVLGIRAIVKFNTARLKALNELLDRTVSERTVELNREKEKLVLANREITDSINYARIIQSSILPSEESLRSSLPGSFIFYLPRNIVSGDFYWFDQYHEEGQSKQIIVLADCTGHGVPGAFMSMIGSEKLNQAFQELASPQPSEILAFVNREVSRTLKKGGQTESRDGMEMGLCFYHQGSDHIDFAGANRPLWIYRAHTHDIEIIKPTKSGIAGGAEYDQFYEGHRIKVSKGDRVFMFSDGAPDQFGGEKGKKLTTRGFRDMLLRLQSEPIQEQKQRLIGFYEHWMQGHEQVDDILIIGFEIS